MPENGAVSACPSRKLQFEREPEVAMPCDTAATATSADAMAGACVPPVHPSTCGWSAPANSPVVAISSSCTVFAWLPTFESRSVASDGSMPAHGENSRARWLFRP